MICVSTDTVIDIRNSGCDKDLPSLWRSIGIVWRTELWTEERIQLLEKEEEGSFFRVSLEREKTQKIRIRGKMWIRIIFSDVCAQDKMEYSDWIQYWWNGKSTMVWDWNYQYGIGIHWIRKRLQALSPLPHIPYSSLFCIYKVVISGHSVVYYYWYCQLSLWDIRLRVIINNKQLPLSFPHHFISTQPSPSLTFSFAILLVYHYSTILLVLSRTFCAERVKRVREFPPARCFHLLDYHCFHISHLQYSFSLFSLYNDSPSGFILSRPLCSSSSL